MFKISYYQLREPNWCTRTMRLVNHEKDSYECFADRSTRFFVSLLCSTNYNVGALLALALSKERVSEWLGEESIHKAEQEYSVYKCHQSEMMRLRYEGNDMIAIRRKLFAVLSKCCAETHHRSAWGRSRLSRICRCCSCSMIINKRRPS